MQLPGPLRAAVGLVASAADEARHLPDRAIELPMLAVSTALQLSLRLQQRYARLAARGDEILTRRPSSDEPPQWATFDDPASADELSDPDRGDSVARSTERTAQTASTLLGRAFGVDAPDNGAVDEPAGQQQQPTKPAAAEGDERGVPAGSGRSSAARSGRGSGTRAGRSSAARTAARKSTKTVSKPRHSPPSKFDAVDDDAAGSDDGDA